MVLLLCRVKSQAWQSNRVPDANICARCAAQVQYIGASTQAYVHQCCCCCCSLAVADVAIAAATHQHGHPWAGPDVSLHTAVHDNGCCHNCCQHQLGAEQPENFSASREAAAATSISEACQRKHVQHYAQEALRTPNQRIKLHQEYIARICLSHTAAGAAAATALLLVCSKDSTTASCCTDTAILVLVRSISIVRQCLSGNTL
jgi:hypothetical protein